MFLKTVLCEEAQRLLKLITKTLHLYQNGLLDLPILKELSWLQKVICSFEQTAIINIRGESNQIPFSPLKVTSFWKEITYYITLKKLDKYFSEQIDGFFTGMLLRFLCFFASSNHILEALHFKHFWNHLMITYRILEKCLANTFRKDNL